ncbi:MAG: hypothetical protein ACLQGT_07450 [Terracidiphilus sp.]
MRTLNPHNSPVSFHLPGIRVYAPLALLAAALCGMQMLPAQTPAAAIQPNKAHKAAHPHKRLVAAPAPAPAPPAAPTPATPPAPELPKWPADEKPAKAAIAWDSQGLRIDAANSSLEEILMEVATLTGAKLEGFDADQRVFGAYGPGPARDVLSQLLLGSGYNVVMIGDQGQGTPRRIVLSLRHAGAATTAANPAPANDEEADTDEQPQQPPQNQPPLRPGFPPGGRSPYQIRELQQRQQQMHPQPEPPQPQQN